VDPDLLSALKALSDASRLRIGREAEAMGVELPGPDGRPSPAYEARVLRAFIGSDGRLERIPAQEKKRLVILRYLAETVFEPGRAYPEK